MPACTFTQDIKLISNLKSRWGGRCQTCLTRFSYRSWRKISRNKCRHLSSECPKMFPPGWTILCILLSLPASARGLVISGYDSDGVICSQGLSDCTMMDEMPLPKEDDDAVDVKNFMASVKLCCKEPELCKLCLLIDTEINIYLDKDEEDGGQSGLDEEDYSEDTIKEDASQLIPGEAAHTVVQAEAEHSSVTVCYSTGSTLPTCKKVEFTVNHTALAQQNEATLSMVITEPAGVYYGCTVSVYPCNQSHLRQVVQVDSLEEVCNQEELQQRVGNCRVPRLDSVINQEMNQVELRSVGSSQSQLSVCIQSECDGKCEKWNNMTIPLHSVTSCTCFQVWEEDTRRVASCPFNNKEVFQRNVWDNVSVFVGQGQMNNHVSMLQWNLSAPCRLDGEVWPCHRESSCREVQGFRQQLNGTWGQNSKGQWGQTGVFEDINLQLLPCVMVKVKGMGHELGPFCPQNTDRWRWTLLVAGVMLLVCLTALVIYLLQGFVKKWVWSLHHGGFVKIGRDRHVVLLSPPDVDDGVSESVCRLGFLLCNQGFSVSVDQWSRKEQCKLGPLPWLHSQLLDLNSQGGRVVLVVTHQALQRAEEWSDWYKEDVKRKGEDNLGLHQMGSPYSDVFMASLGLIQADYQLGRAGERFLLVTFDPQLRGDRSRPELLQGLRLFQLPSQTQALMAELTVGGTVKV